MQFVNVFVASSIKHFYIKIDAASYLERTYHDLSSCLENVHDVLLRVHDLRQKVCLSILEDDLEWLLSECEDILVYPLQDDKLAVTSLAERSVTVIEEVRQLLDR